MNYLRAVPAVYDTNGYVVFTGAVILFLFTLIPVFVKGASDEVY